MPLLLDLVQMICLSCLNVRVFKNRRRNIFAGFVWEVAGLGSQGKAQFLVLEQPEDLGAMQLRCVPAFVYPGYLLRRAATSSAASTEDDAQTAG